MPRLALILIVVGALVPVAGGALDLLLPSPANASVERYRAPAGSPASNPVLPGPPAR